MDNISVTTIASNVTLRPEEPYGIYVANTINNIFGVNAILLNILFLLCICFVPNNDSAYNRFIKNLSVCDIFGALFFLLTLNWPQGPFAHIIPDNEGNKLWIHGSPYVFRSIPWMFFTAYMFTLNCLSVSQYIASCKPHMYDQIRESRNVTIILLVIWGLASLQIFIPVIVLSSLSGLPMREAFGHLVNISKVEMTAWLLVYITSTCISITLNILVYAELRRLRQKQERGVQESTQALSGGSSSSAGANMRAKNEALITILCLSLASIFCRLPLPLVGMMLITFIEQKFGRLVRSWILVIVVMLLYLVFFVEPVIYMCRMPDVRKLLKDKFTKVFGKRSANKLRNNRYSLTQMSNATTGQDTLCTATSPTV